MVEIGPGAQPQLGWGVGEGVSQFCPAGNHVKRCDKCKLNTDSTIADPEDHDDSFKKHDFNLISQTKQHLMMNCLLSSRELVQKPSSPAAMRTPTHQTSSPPTGLNSTERPPVVVGVAQPRPAATGGGSPIAGLAPATDEPPGATALERRRHH